MSGRDSDFTVDLRFGEVGEKYAQDMFLAIVQDRAEVIHVEVKRDAKALAYQNFYVEWRCRGRDGNWYESGIATTKSDWWVYVIGGLVIGAPTYAVRRLVDEEFVRHPEWRKEHRFGENPTVGLAIPFTHYLGHIERLVALPNHGGEAA